MQNKKCDTLEAALERLTDDAIILVGGFGIAGVPEILIEGVCDRGLRGLTIVANNSGTHETGIARLLAEGCVGKIICSFPWAVESFVFKEMYEAGKVDLEVVPQGTLAERLRTAGAGLGGFLTPTAVGTELGAGKPVHEIDGKEYVLERPLRGDFALIKAREVDGRGNLTYRMAARNFNPVMAMAADYTIVEAATEVPVGALDPETIVTPGVFVDCYYVAGPYTPGKEGGPYS
ncbi:MAG: 3-oxoacid CoA-transferase subunit A [Rhodospirillaceae bacterium]|nr:3-oxoacid CoA-transferase subunit A [Rhodospirillaceae bacterium]MDD9925740.1 3-oxoacid CoA-transferase subunit A [Rhodospirillaceae bacterium]|tara:strand:- start:902 stop:1600 length:699 start_codon:yes stop_codon:yes gene_type:complete